MSLGAPLVRRAAAGGGQQRGVLLLLEPGLEAAAPGEPPLWRCSEGLLQGLDPHAVGAHLRGHFLLPAAIDDASSAKIDDASPFAAHIRHGIYIYIYIADEEQQQQPP